MSKESADVENKGAAVSSKDMAVAVAAGNKDIAAEDKLAVDIYRRLRWDASGLICAVAQDYLNGEVLMVAWMDETALARTLRTGRVWYWSRSRQEYWRKGDTSGHIQEVVCVEVDCDGDALLLQVRQKGAACHTGTRSCFQAGGELPVQAAVKVS